MTPSPEPSRSRSRLLLLPEPLAIIIRHPLVSVEDFVLCEASLSPEILIWIINKSVSYLDATLLLTTVSNNGGKQGFIYCSPSPEGIFTLLSSIFT